jgi:hypothetical protein
MYDAEKVVNKAFKDTLKRKEISVYGFNYKYAKNAF